MKEHSFTKKYNSPGWDPVRVKALTTPVKGRGGALEKKLHSRSSRKRGTLESARDTLAPKRMEGPYANSSRKNESCALHSRGVLH